MSQGTPAAASEHDRELEKRLEELVIGLDDGIPCNDLAQVYVIALARRAARLWIAVRCQCAEGNDVAAMAAGHDRLNWPHLGSQ